MSDDSIDVSDKTPKKQNELDQLKKLVSQLQSEKNDSEKLEIVKSIVNLKFEINRQILKETQIGKILNNLITSDRSSSELTEICKSVVNEWKQKIGHNSNGEFIYKKNSFENYTFPEYFNLHIYGFMRT